MGCTFLNRRLPPVRRPRAFVGPRLLNRACSARRPGPSLFAASCAPPRARCPPAPRVSRSHDGEGRRPARTAAPVAWMLETWEGGACTNSAAPGQDACRGPADSPVIEEIRGDVAGEQMRLVTRVRGRGAGPDRPTWDAAQFLPLSAAGDLVSEETCTCPSHPPMRRRRRPASTPRARRPPPPPKVTAPRDGVGVGPRVQMVSDAIALGVDAPRLTHLGRMFGLVAGELMDAGTHTDGRRCRSGPPAPHRADHGIHEVIDGIDDSQAASCLSLRLIPVPRRGQALRRDPAPWGSAGGSSL